MSSASRQRRETEKKKKELYGMLPAKVGADQLMIMASVMINNAGLGSIAVDNLNMMAI